MTEDDNDELVPEIDGAVAEDGVPAAIDRMAEAFRQ